MGHFAAAMLGWKWSNLACDSCQRLEGFTGMQIGHTIVALNLPSWSMLRIATALSSCPPPTPRNCVCVCVWGGHERGVNRVAIIRRGNLTQCEGGRVQGWRWYQSLAWVVWLQPFVKHSHGWFRSCYMSIHLSLMCENTNTNSMKLKLALIVWWNMIIIDYGFKLKATKNYKH